MPKVLRGWCEICLYRRGIERLEKLEYNTNIGKMNVVDQVFLPTPFQIVRFYVTLSSEGWQSGLLRLS